MRILIAHSFYRVAGGEDRHVDEQISLLSKKHDVRLVGPRNEALAPTIGTAARMAWSRHTIRASTEEIATFAPDVVHVHNIYPSIGPAVHLAAERLGIPLVMTVHNLRLRCPNGYMFTEGAICRRCEGGNYSHAILHACFPARSQASAYSTTLWVHRFVLKLEKKISLFVAPSRFMKDRLVGWGIPEERAVVIRNFTHVNTPPSPYAAGDYGVFLGRLSSEKGLEPLLHALAAAGDPRFLVIGDGPLRAPLEALASSLELRNTRFTGWQERGEVARLLDAARYLVMPSLCEENAPLAALEAMAAGIPLLVSPRGGLSELVADGRGLSFDPDDPNDLASKIGTLQGEGSPGPDMAGRARAWAESELTPARHLEALESAYARVISG